MWLPTNTHAMGVFCHAPWSPLMTFSVVLSVHNPHPAWNGPGASLLTDLPVLGAHVKPVVVGLDHAIRLGRGVAERSVRRAQVALAVEAQGQVDLCRLHLVAGQMERVQFDGRRALHSEIEECALRTTRIAGSRNAKGAGERCLAPDGSELEPRAHFADEQAVFWGTG